LPLRAVGITRLGPKGGRRMYVGLGTVLLIILIIVLLIWIF
jgi:hypothetical protein